MDSQLNEYVITQICSYLPISDLKTVRALNSIWNLGSSPILVAKGCNHLNLNNFFTSIEEALYFAETHFPCQSIKISISIPNDLERPSEINQYMDTFSKLFAPNCKQLPPVSHLQFNHRIFNEADIELLNDILQYYSKSLKILVLAYEANWIKRIKLRPSIKLPELKVFWNLTGCLGTVVYQELIVAAPNTISIYPFRRSNQISGLTRLEKDRKFREIRIENVSIPGLQYLGRWSKNLRKCNFEKFDSGADNATLCRELERFLQIQANSLESLDFYKFPCDFKLKWPRFPNIVQLGLVYKDFGCKFEFSSNGVLNYGRDFPKLKSLRIASYSRARAIPESLVPVYDSFFPKNSNHICESLKILNLPERCLEVVENLEERLKRLFPSAEIKYFF